MLMMKELNNESHSVFNSSKYCLTSSDAVQCKARSESHLSLNSAQQ